MLAWDDKIGLLENGGVAKQTLSMNTFEAIK